jgi:hypothetical protein
MILQQVMCCASRGKVLSQPTVLSCGGMYIPHHGSREQVIYEIITTSCREEPVKVVSGARPHNILHEVLIKESLN